MIKSSSLVAQLVILRNLESIAPYKIVEGLLLDKRSKQTITLEICFFCKIVYRQRWYPLWHYLDLKRLHASIGVSLLIQDL